MLVSKSTSIFLTEESPNGQASRNCQKPRQLPFSSYCTVFLLLFFVLFLFSLPFFRPKCYWVLPFFLSFVFSPSFFFPFPYLLLLLLQLLLLFFFFNSVFLVCSRHGDGSCSSPLLLSLSFSFSSLLFLPSFLLLYGLNTPG